MPYPVIDVDECTACGSCVDACPMGVLEIEDEVDGCKEQIVSLLQSEYGVSESQARELLSLDKAEYTSKVVEIAMKKNTGNE